MNKFVAAAVCLALSAGLSLQAADRYVADGASLQVALNSAQPGDTITLQAGATFTGNFIVPNKGRTSAWITIQSSALINLPEGVRVTPASASSLAKLVAPNENPVFTFENSSNHIRLLGLEISAKPNVYNWALIILGNGDGRERTVQDLPSDVIIDRCWIHGDPMTGSKRGITLNSGSTKITNSWFNYFMSNFQDTQAVGGWNGPGPYEISNNHLEATGESVAFGGAVPTIPSNIPADIQITRNHFFKPLSWRGSSWVVKNHLEFKFGRRILIDGNVFENIWAASQAGFAIQLTVRTENGRVPYSAIEDLTFTNNIIRHASGGINFLGKDDVYNDGVMRRITVQDNLFEDISAASWGGLGRLFQILNGPDSLTINHNTSIQDGPVLALGSLPATGFVYTNNISNTGTGIIGAGTVWGTPTLNTYAPGAVFRRNVVAGGSSSNYPADNLFPNSLATVYFTDMIAGNWTLRSDSPYIASSTDGKPAGASLTGIVTAIGNAVVPENGTQLVQGTSLWVGAQELSAFTAPASGYSGTMIVTGTAANTNPVSPASWLQVSAAGANSLNYTVLPNYSAQPRSTTISVADQQFTISQAAAQGTANERYVNFLYTSFLGRSGTAEEIRSQSASLNTGAVTRLNLAMNFLNSLEFNMTSRFVAGLYVGLLNRNAEYGGWLFQRNAMTRGQLTQKAAITNFLTSAEFNLQNPNLSNTEFVRVLYRQVLGREATPAEVSFQASVLVSPDSRIDMAASFLNSAEFRRGTQARLTAFLLFATLLQRNPTSAEMAFREGQLAGGVQVASIAGDFLNSGEFAAQF